MIDNPRLAAALGYARRGWHVLPLHDVAAGHCSCAKQEACETPGKHPRHTAWQQAATTSGADLMEWWEQRPDANVGIITDARSGVWALDIDPDKGGTSSLAHLTERHGQLPLTRVHQTGSGGLHFLFTWPGFDVPTTSGTLGAGIDTRGAGNGQVVAPPSQTDRGSYAVAIDNDPLPAPEWLLDELRRVAAARSAAREPFAAVSEPVDEARIPVDLRHLLSEIVERPHRSERFYRIVATCRRYAYTPGQAVTLVTPWCNATGKFVGRVPLQVAHAWAALENDVELHIARQQQLETPRPSRPATEPKDQPGPALTVVQPVTYSLTDDGNALRLIDAYRDVIRYVPQRGQWLVWSGHRWAWDEAATMRERARDIARQLPDDERPRSAHKSRSLSAFGISAMLALARSDTRIVVDYSALDSHAYDLNTPGGVINLRTGQQVDGGAERLHTRATIVAAAPDAAAPQWETFLADTFAGDPSMTGYVQRLLGLSLIGEVRESLLPFCFGAGANGKTTLLDVVMRLLGLGESGYAVAAPADLLLAKAHDGHPTEIARLAGARVVTCSELDAGQRFAEARIKLLTGKDVITGRFMRQDFFDFRPTHTMWLLGNHMPQVRDGGPAFWRRLRLLPFVHTVPPERQNPELADRLVADEGPAILRWLVNGAVTCLASGLEEPASVRIATGDYARDQDTISRFVDECCVIGDANRADLRVPMAALRGSYETWCRSEGDEPVGPKAFGQGLRARYGITDWRSHGKKFYAGVRLSDLEESDTQQEDPWSA